MNENLKTNHHRIQRLAATVGAVTLFGTLLGAGFAGPAYATGPGTNGKAASHQSSGTAGTSGDVNSPQPKSRADRNGTGANHSGPYDSTRDGSPSRNGNGGGEAKGKPCAGCVGKADNKNPKGQYPGGSDHNAGYECDRNHGIGRGNPAHTGCTSTYPAGCEQDASMPGNECVTEQDHATAPPTSGHECTGDMTGDAGSSEHCDDAAAPSNTPGSTPGNTPPGATTGGSTVVPTDAPEACPLPMSTPGAACTAVSPPMLEVGSALGGAAVAGAPAVSSGAASAPEAGTQGSSASLRDAVSSILPQTGAGAWLTWAALAGGLLVVAGGAQLVLARIRSKA